jgi:hypothetical protein
MKYVHLHLLACLALTCCKQSTKKQCDDGGEGGQSDSSVVLKVESYPWDIRDYGINSAKNLLPLVTSSTADGNTHTWVYKIDKEGAREWGLLFLRTDSPKSASYEVFHETYAGRTVSRNRLNAKESELKIKEIRHLLVDNNVLDRFEYYYRGGMLPEDDSTSIDGDDPFSGCDVNIDTTSPKVQREIAEHINESTLYRIGSVISYYHSRIVVEQAAASDR